MNFKADYKIIYWGLQLNCWNKPINKTTLSDMSTVSSTEGRPLEPQKRKKKCGTIMLRTKTLPHLKLMPTGLRLYFYYCLKYPPFCGETKADSISIFNFENHSRSSNFIIFYSILIIYNFWFNWSKINIKDDIFVHYLFTNDMSCFSMVS